MKEKKSSPVVKKEPAGMVPLFDKTNITWMLIGAGLIALGFLLMAGGKSEDPNVFLADEVYSARRITIAPLLILIGITIEIFALFRQPANRINP